MNIALASLLLTLKRKLPTRKEYHKHILLSTTVERTKAREIAD